MTIAIRPFTLRLRTRVALAILPRASVCMMCGKPLNPAAIDPRTKCCSVACAERDEETIAW